MDYTPTGNPVDGALGDAAEIQAEFALIQAAIASKANSNSPTLVTPTLGVASATSINKVILTAPATACTLTIANGKTLTANHSLTLAGTDSTTMTFPGTSATIARTDAAQTFTGVQDFDGRIDANAGLTVAGADFASRGITDSATAKALTLSGSGANSITIANSATNPTIGTSAGDLQINGSSGKVAQFTSAATPANYVRLQSRATGAAPIIWAEGSDTDVGLEYRTQNAGPHLFITDDSAGPIQVAITHTASANRYITLTGSNGVNPKIATSGGSLDIGSAVVFTGQTVGTTVGAAGGASALPATPLGYLTTSINGTACKIPYYNT